jgi:hypothetical protein
MKLSLTTIAICAGLAASTAHADVSAAARAFSDGQAAQLEGNFERAAQSFELAFNIAPSKEALRSAVRARHLGNQLPRAATLAHLLLMQYPDDADSARLANDVIAEARIKLARIAITCAPHCTVAVGGRAISLTAAPTHVVFATPGHQSLEITFDGDRTVKRDVALKAGDDVALPIAAPPVSHVATSHAAAAAPAAVEPRPLSPMVALAGGAVTLGLAGVAIWSGLDTSKAHDAYAAMPTPEGWSSGRSRQLRTNVLLGATAATAVTTGLIAVFWTNWNGDHRTAPDVAIMPGNGGVTMSYSGRF